MHALTTSLIWNNTHVHCDAYNQPSKSSLRNLAMLEEFIANIIMYMNGMATNKKPTRTI